MDDLNQEENLEEPSEPDLMPPSEPKSGCLIKIIAVLLVAACLGAAGFFLGLDAIKKYITRASNAPQTPPPASTPLPVATPIPEDPNLVMARQLITSDAVTRKNLVAQIVTAPGSKTEAIKFLSNSFGMAAPDVQTDLVSVFGLLAKTNAEAFPPLIHALDVAAVRREAIIALGSLGPTAKEAVPKLKKIAANKKEKKPIRQAAQKALGEIQGKATPKKRKKGKH